MGNLALASIKMSNFPGSAPTLGLNLIGARESNGVYICYCFTFATSITMQVVYQNGENQTLKNKDICNGKLDIISFPAKKIHINHQSKQK